jgi:hypothetical protein
MQANSFPAYFQGLVIECHSADDAEAVRLGERVLHADEVATAAQLRRIAKVLLSYGFASGAEAILGRLAQSDAATRLAEERT